MSLPDQTSDDLKGLNTVYQTTDNTSNLISPVIQTSTTTYTTTSDNLLSGGQGISTETLNVSSGEGVNLSDPIFTMGNANTTSYQTSSQTVDVTLPETNEVYQTSTQVYEGNNIGVLSEGTSGAQYGISGNVQNVDPSDEDVRKVFPEISSNTYVQNNTTTYGDTQGIYTNVSYDIPQSGYEVGTAVETTTTSPVLETTTQNVEYNTPNDVYGVLSEQTITTETKPVVSTTETVSTTVSPIVTTSTTYNTSSFNMDNIKVDPITVPQVYPTLTTQNIGQTSTSTNPVQYLASSTIQGESTSKTLPASYQSTITTTGRDLPTITAPVKFVDSKEENLIESRAPIYEKTTYNKSEIHLGSRKSETLTEINKSSEIQGGVLAPISNNPIILKPIEIEGVSRKPRYESVTVKYGHNISGGLLPPKYLKTRMTTPSVTRLGGRHTTREVVRLAQKIINVPPLQAEYRPIEMKTENSLNLGLRSSKSYDNIFQTSNNLTTVVPEVSTTTIINNAPKIETTTTTYNEVLPEIIEGNTVGIEATTTTVPTSYEQGFDINSIPTTTSVVETGNYQTNVETYGANLSSYQVGNENVSTTYGATGTVDVQTYGGDNYVEQVTSGDVIYGDTQTTYGNDAQVDLFAQGSSATGTTKVVSYNEAKNNYGAVDYSEQGAGSNTYEGKTTTQTVSYGNNPVTFGDATGTTTNVVSYSDAQGVTFGDEKATTNVVSLGEENNSVYKPTDL